MELLARQAADYLERKQVEQEQLQAENTRQLLLSELNHRVKNTLASVQAIAQQTIRSTKDPADFANAFPVAFNLWLASIRFSPNQRGRARICGN